MNETIEDVTYAFAMIVDLRLPERFDEQSPVALVLSASHLPQRAEWEERAKISCGRAEYFLVFCKKPSAGCEANDVRRHFSIKPDFEDWTVPFGLLQQIGRVHKVEIA
jgi:hypothetical protein